MDSLRDIAELTRAARRKMAHETMRDHVGEGLRMDAVFYCLDAIKRFREMGDTKMRAAVYEIAVLGRGGLDINDSAKRYTLTSLPGEFSGLHLVSLMYVGFRQIDPSSDGGIDLSKAHAEAENLPGASGDGSGGDREWRSGDGAAGNPYGCRRRRACRP